VRGEDPRPLFQGEGEEPEAQRGDFALETADLLLRAFGAPSPDGGPAAEAAAARRTEILLRTASSAERSTENRDAGGTYTGFAPERKSSRLSRRERSCESRSAVPGVSARAVAARRVVASRNRRNVRAIGKIYLIRMRRANMFVFPGLTRPFPRR
jgi:hypothetical protein